MACVTKMIKIAAALLLACTAALCVAFMPVSAASDNSCVTDNYLELSDRDIENMTARIEEAAEKTGLNICVVINGGQELSSYGYQDYADVYYEELYGLNTDGVCLAIWFDPNYVHFSTSGKGQKYYNDKTNSILDNVVPKLKEKEVSAAVDIFCRDLEGYAKAAKTRWLAYGGIGFFLGALISLIVFFAVSKRYKNYAHAAASQYVDTSNTVFTEKNDVFIKQYTTKVKIETSSGSGGSGGGSHISSGGGSHGGGGRSF